MTKNTKLRYAEITFILSLIAAVLYNSWPMAFLLDPSTAKHGLASDLEKVRHPYFWFFIACDLLSSTIILAICAICYKYLATTLHSKALKYCLSGLLLFAVFTIIAALLPSDCSITPILRCRVVNMSGGLGIDALTSTIAGLGLFISLIAIRYLSLHHKLSRRLHLITQTTFVLWLISGLLFIYFALTGIAKLALEDVLIVLSGVIISLVGVNIKAIVELELKR